MDTLFRLFSSDLQSDQYQSSSTTRTSSTSRSSPPNPNDPHHHHHPRHQEQEVVEEEECFKSIFMDDDEDLSSSSSKHNFTSYNQTPQHPYQQHQCAPHHPSFPSPETHDYQYIHIDTTISNWATEILLDSARAVADKNAGRLQHLMWMLNELASPYGDTDQKLAAYFLQGLFSRVKESGHRTRRTLATASETITSSFDSTRKTVLKFQEVSPWTTFGHVASNGAILEAFDGESKLHIVDVSNTHCTQWPTLLEALATRSDDTPHLRLTAVVPGSSHRLTREISNRMEKFARLMGLSFKFSPIYHS